MDKMLEIYQENKKANDLLEQEHQEQLKCKGITEKEYQRRLDMIQEENLKEILKIIKKYGPR